MTVNPDEGMQLLTQRMTAQRHEAAADRAALERDTDIGGYGHHSAGTPAGDGKDVHAAGGVDLAAMIGLFTRATAALEKSGKAKFVEWSHCHPIEIPPGPQVSRGVPNGSPAGTTSFYTEADLWGPNDGYVWRVNGWTISLGAGATSFAIWYDSPADPTNLIFSSNVSGRWEPSRFFLMPGRTVCFTGVGGPLVVCKGTAEEMTVAFLPHYLAGSVARYG